MIEQWLRVGFHQVNQQMLFQRAVGDACGGVAKVLFMRGLLAAQQFQVEQLALELRKLLRADLDSMLRKGGVGNIVQASLAIEEQSK
ncbi:hypothetical protein D3C80_1943940 [compost metagenome]